MVFTIPTAWLLAINVLAWPVIHLALAWLGTHLPERCFDPDSWLYRKRRWEGEGRFYERVFAVRNWKGLLPDGSALFRSGFRKKSLASRDRGYLLRFEKETCRAEAVHWATLLFGPLFFLFNPWWAGLIMVVYAVAANGPCIISQRYNRIRMERLRHRRQG